MVSLAGLPSPSSLFSAYASVSASVMLFRTMFGQIIPQQVQNYVISAIRCYFQPRSSMVTLYLDQRDDLTSNELYDAAEIYLCTKISPNVECLKLSKRPNASTVRITFARSEKIADFYQGVELQWQFVSEESHDANAADAKRKYFMLSFHKKNKDFVLNNYVAFVLQKAKEIKDEKKVVKLHTLANMHSYSSLVVWDSINLEHPSTFDTLAMEPSLKKAIKEDLDRFVRREDFYRRVGRAWKRGYLLYGPPGTGKSSLVAAMANYLKFDIYDLDLAHVGHDSDLKKLFLRTSNRSIIVIEDIDCSVKLPERHGDVHAGGNRPGDREFTLSGLLNFIDGLWSSCGDERIIIFTTNDKDKLDPALLRPGRMDMHVHLSYLTPAGFRLLASNYLDDVGHHHLHFCEIEKLLNGGVQVTPAEVAEELMKSDDADVSLEGVVKFLKRKMRENEDIKNPNVGSSGDVLRQAKRLKSDGVIEANGKVHH